MTDDNWDLHKRFGRKVNAEKKRKLKKSDKEGTSFTEVDYDGIARPLLRIYDPDRDGPTPPKKGRKRMTAVYTDERQEIYRASLDRTWLIYGSKCYVHCPTIYHPVDKKTITFTANLFSNNRPVPAGKSKFKYKDKTVSKEKLEVQNGYVEETHTLKPHNNSWYTCKYEGIESYVRNGQKIELYISEGEDTGYIYTYKEYKTPLVVDVLRLIMNKNEEGKLVARVSHRLHGNIINVPSDVPKSGTITFYIDGEQYKTPVQILPSGIATIDYKATHSIGVHQITAVYIPDTEEMKEKYQQTMGANTLFIGDDTNKPKLTQIGKNCGLRNHEHVLEFNSSRKLNGKIRIFIDGTAIKAKETVQNGEITILGNTQELYEQTVTDVTNFKFTFNIADKRNNLREEIWGYSGNHNMIIQYIEFDEEYGDMEYWYFWEDFYVQIETKITIDAELDNTSDEGTFTGNNMYIYENNNTVHYKPSTSVIPKSYVVGNPLKIKVEDSIDNEVIKSGKVKITITSRKKEKWVN